MIVQLPYTESAYLERLREFYRSMLVAKGHSPGGVNVMPYGAQGDFTINTISPPSPGVDVDRYLDLDNPGQLIDALSLPAQYGGGYTKDKKLFHGSLLLTTWVQGVNGATALFSQNYLTEINPNVPSTFVTNYLYKQKITGVAPVVEGFVNVNGADNFVDRFDDVTFTFLRKIINSTTGGVVERTSYKFQGYKINWG